MVVPVLEAVLSIRVIELTCKDHRAAWAATRGGAVGVLEKSAVGGERIEVRRFKNRVAVAAGVLTLVVGHDEYHVARRGDRGRIDQQA